MPSRRRKSPAAAKQLAQALDAAKLDVIAAADPSEPGTFVAALYIPGSQLLVVSAKYAAPTLLTAKLKTKEYRDIYMDLSAASVAGSKLFIIDSDCNGLAAKPEGDDARRQLGGGTQQVIFNGEWGKAKMTEEAYREAVLERGRAVCEDSGAADGAGEAVGVRGTHTRWFAELNAVRRQRQGLPSRSSRRNRTGPPSRHLATLRRGILRLIASEGWWALVDSNH